MIKTVGSQTFLVSISFVSLLNLPAFSYESNNLNTSAQSNNSQSATLRSPSCSPNDVSDIKNAASLKAKETLSGNTCSVIYEVNKNPSYYEYAFTTSSSPYTCRLASTAYIVSATSTANASVPLLKCAKTPPAQDKNKWDTYYQKYNTYSAKTDELLKKWNNLPKIQLYPLPQSPQAANFNAAIYTTYTYVKNTSGSLPAGVEVWFTNVEEMMTVCKKIPNKDKLTSEELSYRFSELLGLPPDAPSDSVHSFAFLRVPTNQISGEIDYKGDAKVFNSYKGAGVFRPCASALTDTGDKLCNSINTMPTNANALNQILTKDDKNPANKLLDKNVAKWPGYQFSKRFFNEDGWPHYPWTGRGYTYDWGINSNNNYGLSEYVMEQFTQYYVYNTKSIADFVKNCSDTQ
ncbi:hypothetical protein [Silvanigrella aquatica]|uniref:Uncharacterized protein n=1 Tax=Silvanigrella aquatica TaxID=1915309 RepID=A0A1L4D1G4_9BACT|nr:hypothetical protein [Silvanigrella aquatica]APJ04038.1 hypothetical protein AXG55_09010 [Silvanigrella aquatica]